MSGTREAPAATALIYGVTTNIAAIAVFAAMAVDASRTLVVGMIGLVAISGFLAYRATRRHLQSARTSDPPAMT